MSIKVVRFQGELVALVATRKSAENVDVTVRKITVKNDVYSFMFLGKHIDVTADVKRLLYEEQKAIEVYAWYNKTHKIKEV